jgi:hypothetical protein
VSNDSHSRQHYQGALSGKCSMRQRGRFIPTNFCVIMGEVKSDLVAGATFPTETARTREKRESFNMTKFKVQCLIDFNGSR